MPDINPHSIQRFEGKVAIVTGGGAGIGQAVVQELLAEGASVAFTDIARRPETEEALLRHNGNILFLQGDMADEDFCRAAVTRTQDQFGRIDCLVNNAFAFTAKGLDATTADWMRSFTAGPLAYARMVQNCAPVMKASGGGAIVNLSSISAHVAQANRWTYNAAKGAVSQLTRCQALDLAASNIRVNSIDPGWIWTNETDKAANLDKGGRKKWDSIWGKYHMLRRMGTVREVARPLLFLLSSDASFITGTTLMVDGGYRSLGPEGLGETAVVAGSR